MLASATRAGVSVASRVSGDVKSTSSRISEGNVAIIETASISTGCPSSSCDCCNLWARCWARTSSRISGGSAARNSGSISPSF
uniref:E3 ubiquitin protein ligase upl2, putative n=1 Tax=Arundo donax TaxID=35708 RepID=A0A0A8YRF0_ARUDO